MEFSYMLSNYAKFKNILDVAMLFELSSKKSCTCQMSINICGEVPLDIIIMFEI